VKKYEFEYIDETKVEFGHGIYIDLTLVKKYEFEYIDETKS
jgi:hypothetical protein